MKPTDCDVLIIGGGPGGLHAAEQTSSPGLRTILADAMPSVGRKFLVAGKGGLNLTHSEPLDQFVTHYGEPSDRWRDLLAAFSPDDLRAWSHGLGIETFVGTSGRVFPETKQAAPLLRRWISRLRQQGVVFKMRSRFVGLRGEGREQVVTFSTPEGERDVRAGAVILALGGGSWPQTGSTGTWTELLRTGEIEVTPLAPANCGWEVDWPPEFLAVAEGLPLKNIVARAGDETVAGELLITKYGLEGGAIYELGRTLRGMAQPEIVLDLKPTFTVEQLRQKPIAAWKLSKAAAALLASRVAKSAEEKARFAKAFPVSLHGPRSIAEAISSAGGVAWRELDENLMLKKRPGLFCAGEMIDWEAPTGGYLLQGCFATGARAARGAAAYLKSLA